VPQHTLKCERCEVSLTTLASQAVHNCKKNGDAVTALIEIAKMSPVDICCDGCDAERIGADFGVYTEPYARTLATEAGWRCVKSGDWCPRCVAEGKAT
jgi:hypothetical protein